MDSSVCRRVLLWPAFQNARPHKFEVPIPDVCAIFNALFPFFPHARNIGGPFYKKLYKYPFPERR